MDGVFVCGAPTASAGICADSYVFGCHPSAVCAKVDGVCGLKEDQDLANDFLESNYDLGQRAEAYNESLSLSDLTRLASCFRHFSWYGKALLEPGDRPKLAKRMQGAKGDLKKVFALVTQAFERQDLKYVDFEAFFDMADDLENVEKLDMKKDGPAMVQKLFPKMSEETAAKVILKVTEALDKFEECKGNPSSAECGKAVWKFTSNPNANPKP